MENEIVIGALVRKRAHLAGQLEAARATIQAITTDLGHVDATLRLFDPAAALRPIKPIKERAPTRFGNLTRTVMEELRASSGPVLVKQLVTAVMARSGVPVEDRQAALYLTKQVGSTLRDGRRRGVVVSEHGEGRSCCGGWGNRLYN